MPLQTTHLDRFLLRLADSKYVRFFIGVLIVGISDVRNRRRRLILALDLGYHVMNPDNILELSQTPLITLGRLSLTSGDPERHQLGPGGYHIEMCSDCHSKSHFDPSSELIVYLPILVVSVILVLRNGHGKKSGWIFLTILCIMREIGAFTHILSETSDKSSTTVKIVYVICEQSGVSPLLLATLGFLETVLIYAGVIAAVIFVALFSWDNRRTLMRYRQVLLKAVMATLPFLAVRVLYTILSAFAPPAETISSDGTITRTASTSGIGEFSSTTGSWALYLIMSVLTEFVIITILIVIGIRTPLQQDYAEGANRFTGSNEELTGLKPYDPPSSNAAYAPYAPSS